ncbi:MAG: ParM/StbA family protein [Lachnospiraceae bacterium]|nr:ParM/StbA family protein [Butyrivibrio crossotus]MDY2607059.1 ParM/StbA family protein [Lachnospiraceae bacterium]
MSRNIKIIAIDHGWSHIKTKNTVFVSGVEENISPTFFDNVLEYNGKYYNIGARRIEVKDTKVDNDDFYLLTLAAVAKELSIMHLTEADVYLAVGLPLTRFGEEKNAFIDYLSRDKEVRFKYAETEYHINIVKVSVFPQCYAAVADIISTFARKVAVIDIGSWTVDIMPVIAKKPDDQRCNSIPHGIITCMRDINRACIKKFNYELDERDIEHYIRYHQISNIPDEAVRLMDSFLSEYAAMIIRSLKEMEINIQTTPIVFVGGGAVIMKNYGNMSAGSVQYKLDVKANAKGYELLAKIALGGR